MTEFGMETKHDGPCLVYSDHKLADVLMRDAKDMKPELIYDKRLERMKGLAKTYASVTKSLDGYSQGAFKRMVAYDNPVDHVLSQFGLADQPKDEVGVVICKTCLQNAIIACEEVLQTLTDIQKAVE